MTDASQLKYRDRVFGVLFGFLFLSLPINGYGQVTFNVPGSMDHYDLAGDPSNPILAAAAVTTNRFFLGDSAVVHGGAVDVLFPDAMASSAGLRIRNSAYPFSFADLMLYRRNVFFGIEQPSDPFAGRYPLVGDLVYKPIPAGSIWSLEPIMTGNASFDLPEVRSRELSFTLLAEPSVAPPPATDLGVLVDGTPVQRTITVPARSIVWYKFTLSQPVDERNLRYLDIHTGLTPENVDTAIALFSEAGVRITRTDNNGSVQCLLTYGPGAPPRPAPTEDLIPGSGRHGSLPVGTYYLAVGGIMTTAAKGFAATGVHSMPSTLTLRLNPGFGPAAVAPNARDLGELSNGVTFAPPVTATEYFVPRWYKFTLSQPITTANRRFLDIDNDGYFGSTTRMGLYDLNGNLLAPTFPSGSGGWAQLSFGPGGFSRPRGGGGQVFDGRHGELPAGTYYLSVADGAAGTFPISWAATQYTTRQGPIPVRINLGAGTQPASPLVFRDLGSLVPGQTTVDEPYVNANGTVWIRFVLTDPISSANADFLDIDTLGTQQFLGNNVDGPNDTFLALYDNDGRLLSWNRDGADGRRSLLSFGPTAGDRGRQGTRGFYLGQNGNLPAGVYWLAVLGGWANADHWFNVSNPSLQRGPVKVNFRLDAPVVGPTLLGNVLLPGWQPSLARKNLQFRLYQGTTLVADAVVNPNDSGQYEVRFVGVLAGVYDVFVRTDTFLWKKLPGVSLGAIPVVRNLTLVNGDVSPDNEVNANDFSVMSNSWDTPFWMPGHTPTADLNGDDEVGAADFSILASTYDSDGDPLPQP